MYATICTIESNCSYQQHPPAEIIKHLLQCPGAQFRQALLDNDVGEDSLLNDDESAVEHLVKNFCDESSIRVRAQAAKRKKLLAKVRTLSRYYVVYYYRLSLTFYIVLSTTRWTKKR